MEKTLQELNLEDDFLFAKVMTDTDLCKGVLEKILNIEIERIEFLVGQNVIDILFGSKGIRLDIYVKDDKGTVFCCEMQRGKKRELPKRSRYYQGNIDLDLVSKGSEYSELKTSYVIFICTFDPFNKMRYYYTFKEICIEDNTLLLDDETTKVFLNTKGKIGEVDDVLKEFLGYVEDSTEDYVNHAKSELVKSIHKKVIEVKESKEMEVEYMTLLQRDREMREEGERKGRKETLVIIKLHLKGYSVVDISNELKIEPRVVEECILDFESK